jgi:hypothetical protein
VADGEAGGEGRRRRGRKERDGSEKVACALE